MTEESVVDASSLHFEIMGVGMRNGFGGVMSLDVRVEVGVGCNEDFDVLNQSSSSPLLSSGVLKISCNSPLL